MSLDSLKSSGSLNKLLDAAKGETEPQEKKSYVDERLWKPELDKSGNGYAVIRFLPAVKGEDLPWAKVWNHAFQGPTGQWYIENSLTTLNQKDPVSEHNTRLWNTGLESDKEIAVNRKESCNTSQTFMWLVTLNTQRTKAKYSCSAMGKKSLIRLLLLCHQSLKMKRQSTHLILGRCKLQTKNQKGRWILEL